MEFPPEPPHDCPRCPRLVAFRRENEAAHPDWFNAPVPSFGDPLGRLLIVGLAPGLKGANRTGRPFTGDYAGTLLFDTLIEHGFAKGRYGAEADDGLELVDCMIANAVRCVPPKNKPDASEIATCRPFLLGRISAMPRLSVILALGRIAHESVIAGLGLKRGAWVFGHGNSHAPSESLRLYDSYHCSRQNTNTGRLTPVMFSAVLREIRTALPIGS